MKHNAATNQIVVFVKVDETFTMTFKVIRGQGQGQVRLKFSKMTIFKFYLLRHFFNQSKNPTVSDTRPKYLKSPGFLNFLLVSSHVTSNCQKIDKNFFRPILMKLGMMLEVDETFTTI